MEFVYRSHKGQKQDNRNQWLLLLWENFRPIGNHWKHNNRYMF